MSDNTTLLSVSRFDTVRLWDTISGHEQEQITTADGVLRQVAISPDGNYVATATTTNRILLWDTTTGQLRLRIDGRSPFAWSPDGTRFAFVRPDTPDLDSKLIDFIGNNDAADDRRKSATQKP
ncbi:MAG: hypothetical protein GY767_18835 [Shimia sp.]|nr:hypothetical protein [Shimia sp.]